MCKVKAEFIAFITTICLVVSLFASIVITFAIPRPIKSMSFAVTSTKFMKNEIGLVNEAYNMIDPYEAEQLAMLVQLESGGIPNRDEQAAVVWCVLNRVDDETGRFPDTITEVLLQPGQFYSKPLSIQIDPESLELVYDILFRWYISSVSEGHLDRTEVTLGRTIPHDYLFYYGDGEHNYFRREFLDYSDQWDWSYPEVYGVKEG